MSYDLGEIGLLGTSKRPVVLSSIQQAQAHTLAERIAAMPPWSLYPYRPEDIRRYLIAHEAHAPRYVLQVAGETAGVIGLVLNWLRGPYVQMLAILPEYQSQRLGAIALTWVERTAREAKERNIWVCASQFNVDAQRFYARCGFLPVASLDGVVTNDQTEILMRKVLYTPST